MANPIVSVHAGIYGWGYMRLCWHLVGSRSLIALVNQLKFADYTKAWC